MGARGWRSTSPRWSSFRPSSRRSSTRFEALEDAPLRARVESLMARAGFAAQRPVRHGRQPALGARQRLLHRLRQRQARRLLRHAAAAPGPARSRPCSRTSSATSAAPRARSASSRCAASASPASPCSAGSRPALVLQRARRRAEPARCQRRARADPLPARRRRSSRSSSRRSSPAVAPARVRGRRLRLHARGRPRPRGRAAQAARGQRLDADARSVVRALLLFASAGRSSASPRWRRAGLRRIAMTISLPERARPRAQRDERDRRSGSHLVRSAAGASTARSRSASPSRAVSRRSPSSTPSRGCATSRITIPSWRLASTAASSASRPIRSAAFRQRLHLRGEGRCPRLLRRLKVRVDRERGDSASARRRGPRPPLHGREPRKDAASLCHPRGKKSDASSAIGSAGRLGDEGVIERVCRAATCCSRQDESKTKSFAADLDQLLVAGRRRSMFSESQLRAR